MGVQAWITVNGQHIPIMDGESKMAAVSRFIKGKRDKKPKIKSEDELYDKMSKEDKHKWDELMSDYNGNVPDSIYQKFKDKYMGKTIKGRARTKEQWDKDWFDTYEKSKTEDKKEITKNNFPNWDKQTRESVIESNAYGRANTMLENRYRNNKQIGKSYKLKANYMTQKDIDKAYKKEDYSEVIRNLSRTEKANLKQAYKDLDFYSRGSKGYKEAKSYIDKMEAKAMMSHKSKKK